VNDPVPGAPLRAVTVALPPGEKVDPVALAGAQGVLFAGAGLTLAGWGVAAQLPLAAGLEDGAGRAAVAAWLAAVPVDDAVNRPGTGVVAHGALPFDRAGPATLVVPRLTYGIDEEGHEWVTLVGESPEVPEPADLRRRLHELSSRAGGGSRSERPARLVPRPEPGAYVEAVARAVAAIGQGRLRKVVLARALEVQLADPVDPVVVARRLLEAEPGCTVFAHPVAGGRFLGATPELLVSRRGTSVGCHPLAGTVGVVGPGGDEAAAGLLTSAKDLAEHRPVVEAIATALEPFTERLDVPERPSLLRLHRVAHLASPIGGTLRTVDGVAPGVLELLAALHPTPAVGGTPRHEALALVAELEPVPRGHWAGPVGWLDGRGDGDWIIGIRSATVAGDRALLLAGAGIVADSVPAAELAETSLKMMPVLEALAPGASAQLA